VAEGLTTLTEVPVVYLNASVEIQACYINEVTTTSVHIDYNSAHVYQPTTRDINIYCYTERAVTSPTSETLICE
jgi:hypothetical protein